MRRAAECAPYPRLGSARSPLRAGQCHVTYSIVYKKTATHTTNTAKLSKKSASMRDNWGGAPLAFGSGWCMMCTHELFEVKDTHLPAGHDVRSNPSGKSGMGPGTTSPLVAYRGGAGRARLRSVCERE
jgi:hypothetical protein